MKLFQIYWRASGGRTGETFCKAGTPAEAVTHFRKICREHSLHNKVWITGIAEDQGTLALRMVQP